jgi:hypothetical protein
VVKKLEMQQPVSANNPCPFLRALVASGKLADAREPLAQVAAVVAAAASAGDGQPVLPRAAIYAIASVGNGLGAWAAEIQDRAGVSCGASLGAGEALDRPQQRAGNNGWPRKWPRPSGLAPQWGRCVVIPLARGAAPGGALRLASPPLRG